MGSTWQSGCDVLCGRVLECGVLGWFVVGCVGLCCARWSGAGPSGGAWRRAVPGSAEVAFCQAVLRGVAWCWVVLGRVVGCAAYNKRISIDLSSPARTSPYLQLGSNSKNLRKHNSNPSRSREVATLRTAASQNPARPACHAPTPGLRPHTARLAAARFSVPKVVP